MHRYCSDGLQHNGKAVQLGRIRGIHKTIVIFYWRGWWRGTLVMSILAAYLRVAKIALYLLSLDISSLFLSTFVHNASFWIELVLLALLWASGDDSPRAVVLPRCWDSSTPEPSLVGVLETTFRLGVDSLKEEKSKSDCSLLELSVSLMSFEEDWEVWSSSVSKIWLWMSLFRIGLGLIIGLGVGLWETEFTELEDFDLW